MARVLSFVALQIFTGKTPEKQFDPAAKTFSAGNSKTDAEMVPVNSLLDTSKVASQVNFCGLMKLKASKLSETETELVTRWLFCFAAATR